MSNRGLKSPLSGNIVIKYLSADNYNQENRVVPTSLEYRSPIWNMKS